MLKKISNFCMIVILSLMMIVPAYAQTVTPVDGNNSLTASFPIFTSAEGTIGNSKNDPNTGNSITEDSILTTSIIRDGNTEDCEIYLNWSGTDLYNAWKFTSCTVDNAGILIFHKEYGEIDGTTKYVTAASKGTVKLGEVKIPTDVTRARVNISGLQGYNMNSGSWLSALIIGKLGNIN